MRIVSIRRKSPATVQGAYKSRPARLSSAVRSSSANQGVLASIVIFSVERAVDGSIQAQQPVTAALARASGASKP